MLIKEIVEGYKVLPPIDKERYQARDGLEGPFRLRNGKVVYYDPQEGSYYDPDTDMYISYDDYKKMDEQGVAEGKIKLFTDPDYFGAEVGDYKASGPIVNIPSNRLVGFEPDDKMNQPASKANVEKIVAGLKQGAKLPPLLVRQYKNGYQVLDGHHRFWAYKLLGVKSIPAQVVPAEDVEEVGKQGVAEGDKRPSYIAKASSRPKKVKPSTGGSSPHPYQGKLVGESEVSNTDYEWTHGKKPKGTGSWFFVAHKGGVNFGKDVEGEDYIQLNQMSYADAKKAAIKWAKSKGHTSLYVGT